MVAPPKQFALVRIPPNTVELGVTLRRAISKPLWSGLYRGSRKAL